MEKFSGKVGNKRNLWETIYYVLLLSGKPFPHIKVKG